MRLQKPDIQQFAQGASCILCLLVTLRVTDGFDGTEFAGGWLTGPLLTFAEVGILVFLIAFLLTFLLPRSAAAFGLVASLLSLPLYLYFINPVAFAHLFAPGHEFKDQPTPGFHWGKWTVTGVLMLILAVCLCVRRMAKSTTAKLPV